MYFFFVLFSSTMQMAKWQRDNSRYPPTLTPISWRIFEEVRSKLVWSISSTFEYESFAFLSPPLLLDPHALAHESLLLLQAPCQRGFAFFCELSLFVPFLPLCRTFFRSRARARERVPFPDRPKESERRQKADCWRKTNFSKAMLE